MKDNKKQKNGQSELLIIFLQRREKITFPPTPDGQTYIRTYSSIYRVASLLKSKCIKINVVHNAEAVIIWQEMVCLTIIHQPS